MQLKGILKKKLCKKFTFLHINSDSSPVFF